MRHLDRLSDGHCWPPWRSTSDALAVRPPAPGVRPGGDDDGRRRPGNSQHRCFEAAWRHAGGYDARRAAVTTWLLTITRNLAIDALRVRRDVPRDPWAVGDLSAQPWPVASTDDPLEAALATDQLGRLVPHLAALSREQRRAVLLATVGGRTAAEIAAIEGIPVGTAKTRIRNGLRRLRAVASEVTS
ncbi:MAG: sigma-70 family RNA polymerase sigma factor [Acidimicrobiales bacterium]